MTGRFLLWAVCGIFALCLAFALTVGIVQNAYSWSNASPPPFIATIDVWKLGMVTGLRRNGRRTAGYAVYLRPQLPA